MRSLTNALVLLVVTGASVACGASSSGDDVVAGEEDDVTSANAPLGTFEGTDTKSDFPTPGASMTMTMLLTLKSDKTFHFLGTIACAPSPCSQELEEAVRVDVDGSYRLTKKQGKRFLKLNPSKPTDILESSYEFTFDGKRFVSKGENEDEWDTMTLSKEAWCKAASDCSLQGLPAPACGKPRTCEASTCVDVCAKPARNACEAAGGTCVPVAPPFCGSDRVIGDMDVVPCAAPGQLGLMCCLPE